jgi:hypothetical protein
VIVSFWKESELVWLCCCFAHPREGVARKGF